MATTISTDDIQGLYIAYFNRPADYRGLLFWQEAATKAGSLEVVANAFSASPEYTSAFAGLSNLQIVDQIYMNLFGRHAELDGLNFWTSALEKGILNIGNVAYQIMKGAHDTEGGFQDATAVASKIKAAAAFYDALDTAAEVIAYSGDTANAQARSWLSGITDQASLDAATTQEALDQITSSIVSGSPTNVGKTFTLTTGIDNVIGTAGNDTINAILDSVTSGATLTSLDKIDGGAGVDTLTIIGNGASSAAGLSVKNVENVVIVSSTAITGTDVSGWTGLTDLKLTAGGAIGATGAGNAITSAATTNVTVDAGLSDVYLDGGKDVSVSTKAGTVSVINTAGSATVTNTGTGDVFVGTTGNAVKGAVTVKSSGGDVSVVGGTTVSVSEVGGVSLADRTAHADALAAASAKIVGGFDSATNTTYTTAQALTAALTALVGTGAGSLGAATSIVTNNAATKAAFEAGFLTAAQKLAIDAAFSAALPQGTAQAVAAAIAVATPFLTSATTAEAAALAARTTATNADNAAIAAAQTIVNADNAAGAIVGAATVTTTGSTATSATVKGNYGSTNTVSDSSTQGNVLTTVTLDNAGATTINGNAVSTVTVTGNEDDVIINNATVGHSLTLNVAGVVAGTYTDTVATTVSLVGTGSDVNELALAANSATKLNLSGASGFEFDALTLAANAVVDASKTTGSVKIAIDAGQGYTGGSGADTVSIIGTTVQAQVVTGGAGTADRLILNNAASFGTGTVGGATVNGATQFSGFEILELASGLTVDVSKFTNDAFTSLVLDGSATVSALNATQAAAVTLAAGAGTYALNLGITGATTVGQIDTLNLAINDGTSTKRAITLTAPTLAGIEVVNLANAENTTITSLANATALTNVNVTGAGSINITTGALALNVNTIIDAHAATGAVTVNAAASTQNGLKIIGSLTKANILTGNTTLQNSLVGGDGGDTLTGGSAADSITSGNGKNVIDGKGGADVITVGNGNNTINAGGIAYTGDLTVKAGDGTNVITGGTGNDKITVGSGSNYVTGGAGADTITFGTHVAGVVDGIVQTAANQTFSAASIVTGATLTGVDVVTGLHTGDTIDISGISGGFTGAAATTLAGAAGTTVALVLGNYDSTTHIWTTAAGGHDTLFVYDADGAGAGTAVEAIVLVGSTVAGTATGGIVTLA